MNKITAHSLDIKPSQKLDIPVGAKLLTVNVDHRFNKCLLWTVQDDSAALVEEVTFTMAKLNEEANVGQYVGTFKDNSGYVHVFAQHPAKSPVTAIREAAQVASMGASKSAKSMTTAGAAVQAGAASVTVEVAE